MILIDDVPPGTVQIESGLLSAVPRSVIVLPVLFEDQVKAVIELASLTEFTAVAARLPRAAVAARSASCSTPSRRRCAPSACCRSRSSSPANCSRSRRNCSRPTRRSRSRRTLLAEQKAEVERKNQEIEHARRALEEKAAELALTSRYKSEFLANMSHELRTPLNSILILGQQLAENPDENLSDRQVEFAKTIHAAGTDLLHLISDILDLSKIESGTVTVDSEEIAFAHLRENIERGFRHEAERRQPGLLGRLRARARPRAQHRPQAPAADPQEPAVERAKFTEQRQRAPVRARGHAAAGRRATRSSTSAPTVVAFEVTDTGIGISPEKQKIVFEAFQQADAGTSRKYGGTGLGLAISREIAGLLGGELRLQSAPGKGSTFTLYLPLDYVGAGEPMPSVLGQPHRAGARAAARRAPRSELMEVDDDRDELRPGRADAAGGRGRPALRGGAARPRALARLPGAGRQPRRRSPAAGARVHSPARSRSTSSCPTCSAGRCSRA